MEACFCFGAVWCTVALWIHLAKIDRRARKLKIARRNRGVVTRTSDPEWLQKKRASKVKQTPTVESSEKTIAILGDRWWPQTARQEGDRISKQCFHVMYGKA